MTIKEVAQKGIKAGGVAIDTLDVLTDILSIYRGGKLGRKLDAATSKQPEQQELQKAEDVIEKLKVKFGGFGRADEINRSSLFRQLSFERQEMMDIFLAWLAREHPLKSNTFHWHFAVEYETDSETDSRDAIVKINELADLGIAFNGVEDQLERMLNYCDVRGYTTDSVMQTLTGIFKTIPKAAAKATKKVEQNPLAQKFMTSTAERMRARIAELQRRRGGNI